MCKFSLLPKSNSKARNWMDPTELAYPTTPLERSTYNYPDPSWSIIIIWLTSYSSLTKHILQEKKSLFFFTPSLPVCFFFSFFPSPTHPQPCMTPLSPRPVAGCTLKGWHDLSSDRFNAPFGYVFPAIHVSPFRSSPINEWLRLVAHPIIRIPSSKGIINFGICLVFK